MSVREQVIGALVDVISTAEAQSKDGMKAAATAFPGTPDTVLWQAWALFEHRRTEQWWSQVERTIDGEIIRTALLRQSLPPMKP